MSAMQELADFIRLTETLSPKVRRSKLWRHKAAQAMRAAARAELGYNDEARSASLENEICQDEELPDATSMPGINDMLTELLKRPPRST